MGPLSDESRFVLLFLAASAILPVVLARESGIRLDGLAVLAFVAGVGLVFVLQISVIVEAARGV